MQKMRISPGVSALLLTSMGILFFNAVAFAQVPGLAWSKNIGGEDSYVFGISAATDLSGNVYTTGHFEGTVDFDPGTETFELTSLGNDGFVSKVDANGNFVWAVRFGGVQYDEGRSITIDAAANVVVGGYFAATADFDPGPGDLELTAFGIIDGFILKLTSNGDLIFAKQVGGVDEDYVTAVQTDLSNNIYFTGGFTGVADFDPGVTILNLTSNGEVDVFTGKLDAGGNFAWAQGFGDSGTDNGNSIVIDPAGSIYVAGQFEVGASSGDYLIFINKLDDAGSLTWNYEIAGAGPNTVHSIRIDASGDIYFSGYVSDIVDFDPLGAGFDLGPTKYICKLNSSANMIWAIGLDEVSLASMTLDINGDIFLTGSFFEVVDIDPGAGIAQIFGSGSDDQGMFVLKLDGSGDYLWGQAFNTFAGGESGNFITTDNAGNIYVIGELPEAIDFATGVCSTGELSTDGETDLFLLKLNPSSVPATCFGVIEQPVSAVACEGDGVLLSALSAGAPRITYQWQKFNGSIFVDIADQEADGESDDEGYEGTGTPYLTVVGIDNSGTGQFRCRVSGYLVTDVFSDVATLTYSASTSIPYVVANSGCGPGQYMITAFGGTEGNYAWYENGALIDGAVNSTYTTSLISTPTEFSVSKATGTCVSAPVTIEVNTNACAPFPGLVWAAQPQTTDGIINIGKMAIDAAGNIYAVGYFLGTVDFDSGPGTAILSTAIADEKENFLLKLTSDRDVVWVKSLNDISFTIQLSVDGASNIYLAGLFEGTIDFDPGTGVFNMTATGNRDMFVTKLDTDGNFVWAKRMGGSGTNLANPQSVASDGNGVYTTGGFTGTIDFDPNAGTQNRSSAGSTFFGDIFISKLDPDGNFAWAHRMGRTSASDGGRAIKVDASGNVYSIGTFSGTVDFDPGAGSAPLTGLGSTDTYIHKLNNAGIFQWARSIDGAGVELPFALALDASGNPHLAGTFGTIIPNQTVDFDPGPGTFNLVSNEGIVFILKLAADASFTWAKNFGGTFGAEPRDITVDPSGNVLMTGHAEGNIDFDPGPAIYSIHSNVNRDAFVTQLDVNGNFSWAYNLASTGLSYYNNDGLSIVTESDGSIYTAGNFTHTSDFDPGHCTFPLFADNGNAFIQKIRPGIAALCFNLQPIAASGCTGTPAIFTVAATGTTNITYQWQKLNTVTSLFENITDTGGYSGTASPDLEIDTNGNFGAGTYQCLVTGDNAPDKTSDQVSLIVNVIPSPPTATGSTACTDESQTLSASGSTDGNYRWYNAVVDGTAIPGATNSTYATPQLSVTTNYYVSINDGTCESPRTEVVATVISLPPDPSATSPSRCGPGTLTLTASGGTNGEYRWYDVDTAGTPLPGENNSTYITPPLTNTTTYYVAINNGTCESTRVPATATINNLPPQPSITPSGATTFCPGGSVILTAPAATAFIWSTGATTQEITVNTAGDYTVSVTDANGCTSPVSNAITVTIQNCNQPPTIATTPLATQAGGMVTFNLLSLLADPDDNMDISTLQIISQPESGATASIDAQGNLIIDYGTTAFTGTDRLTIEVCDLDGSCAQQELFVDVTGEVMVYNALSPNDDGKNEAFIIQHIDIIPDAQNNKVTIFNRWGDVVSEIENYNNQDRVFKGLSKNGNALPSGTYFYKVEFGSGRATRTGYLMVKH